MLYYTLGQNIEKKTHWPPIAAVTADGPSRETFLGDDR